MARCTGSTSIPAVRRACWPGSTISARRCSMRARSPRSKTDGSSPSLGLLDQAGLTGDTMRVLILLAAATLSLASCGPQPEAAKAPAEEAKPDSSALEKQKQAEQKAAFEAVKTDEAKISELADAGNGFALYHR